MLLLPILILYSSDCSSHSINVFFEPIQREFVDYFRRIIFRNTGSIDGNGEKFSIKVRRQISADSRFILSFRYKTWEVLSKQHGVEDSRNFSDMKFSCVRFEDHKLTLRLVLTFRGNYKLVILILSLPEYPPIRNLSIPKLHSFRKNKRQFLECFQATLIPKMKDKGKDEKYFLFVTHFDRGS